MNSEEENCLQIYVTLKCIIQEKYIAEIRYIYKIAEKIFCSLILL